MRPGIDWEVIRLTRPIGAKGPWERKVTGSRGIRHFRSYESAESHARRMQLNVNDKAVVYNPEGKQVFERLYESYEDRLDAKDQKKIRVWELIDDLEKVGFRALRNEGFEDDSIQMINFEEDCLKIRNEIKALFPDLWDTPIQDDSL